MAFEGTQEALTFVGEAGERLADELGVWGTLGAYFVGVLGALVGIGKGGQFVAEKAGKLFKSDKNTQEA